MLGNTKSLIKSILECYYFIAEDNAIKNGSASAPFPYSVNSPLIFF
jgi:hypothetical protein